MTDAEKKLKREKVVSLEEKRAELSFKQKEKEFKTYLSNLKLNELRHEANFIIDRMGEEDLEDEFLLKGAMLMEELAKRIEGDKMSEQVSIFAKTLKDKYEAGPEGPVYH